jgi:elongation factor P
MSSCAVATVAIGSSWRQPSHRTVSSTDVAEPSRSWARIAIRRASSMVTSRARAAGIPASNHATPGTLLRRMAEIVDTNSFRNGMHIEHKGGVWRIVQFQHVKPGKGGAFVRTKLKNLDSGAVVDETFRAGEKFARVHTEVRNVQFLYDDGSEAHFMDQETFEQFGLASADVADELAYMLPSSTVQILQVNGKPSGLQLPASVELTVSDTEPGVKGDTVSNVTKPATLETGAVVQVPLFVNVGDRLKVDPREARYISRA